MTRAALLACVLAASAVSPARAQPARVAALELTSVDARGIVIEQSARTVIRDSAAWLGLWKTWSKGKAPPPVDFQKSTVIVVARGWTSSTGYSMVVDSVIEYADRVNVHIKSVVPGPCPPQFVANYPQSLVLVPARAKPVYFRERTEAACPPDWGN